MMMLVTVHKEGPVVWPSSVVGLSPSLVPQIMSSRIVDTTAPDALVSRRGVIVEIMGHGAISPHPLVSFLGP